MCKWTLDAFVTCAVLVPLKLALGDKALLLKFANEFSAENVRPLKHRAKYELLRRNLEKSYRRGYSRELPVLYAILKFQLSVY